LQALRPAGSAFLHVLNALTAATLGPHCAACDAVLDAPFDGPVCVACWSQVRPVAPPACLGCGQPLPSWRTISVHAARCAACRRRPPAFDRGAVACDYANVLRAVVHAFKYDGRKSLARPLGRLLREAGRDVLDGADAVVPVPLHPWKRLRRGFNQSAELAHRLGVPVRPVLRRRRATRTQAGLTPGQRRRNVAGAFVLAPWPWRGPVERQVLVLVDDVMTTGATLDACARVLKQAGAKEVRALTLARALPPASRPTAP
jgi:ComF family protein